MGHIGESVDEVAMTYLHFVRSGREYAAQKRRQTHALHERERAREG
jgi:hypothetical protein